MKNTEKAQKAINKSEIENLIVQTDDGGHVFIANRYKGQNQRKISVDSKDSIDSVIERLCAVMGVGNWGGPRPGAGRPAVGGISRRPRAIRLSDDEYKKVKEFLETLRN